MPGWPLLVAIPAFIGFGHFVTYESRGLDFAPARRIRACRPVFAYDAKIRRLLYTTNAIESLHMQLRKIVKTRGHFPSFWPKYPHSATR